MHPGFHRPTRLIGQALASFPFCFQEMPHGGHGFPPDLIQRCRDGDRDAFDRLFRHYAGRLAKVAEAHLHRRLAGCEDSEDVGTAGSITLNAPSITIGNNVQILAGGATPGAITLTADKTMADPGLALWDFLGTILNQTTGLKAGITIGSNDTIQGGAFTATATAADSEVLATAEAFPFLGQLLSQTISYVNDLTALPVSVVVKEPSATVTVGTGTQITNLLLRPRPGGLRVRQQHQQQHPGPVPEQHLYHDRPGLGHVAGHR
jgi:hypothetical protein